MKHFLVFILILVSNSIFACGFYPYAEDVRFSFFNPSNFKYRWYSDFNYSSLSFSVNQIPADEEITVDANEKLWIQYCKNKVSAEAVREVLFDFKLDDITDKSTNEMLQYLYKTKDIEAVDYLKFAKNCEVFNVFYDNLWEQNNAQKVRNRTKLIDQAILLSNSVKNKNLKQRYTFLAIRLAYYNGDFGKIRTLYAKVFKTQKQGNVLKYWSLYFRTFAEPDKATANFYASQVFANAPDKRFMVSFAFNAKIPIDAVLKHAKTNKEKANVYLLAGIKKADHSLYYLKQVYKYNPEFDGLAFLLLREINKIEDWVFTPYYSLFNPSVGSYDRNEENSVRNIMQRVEKDRIYAGQVIEFINNVNLKKVHDPALWKTGKAYLALITKDNQGCLKQISKLEKSVSRKDSLYNQIEIIKALALTVNQQVGKAVILNDVKPILLKNKTQKKFLFAVGRELEYKGNRIDASFLYSKLEENDNNDDYNNYAYWKSSKAKIGYYTDYYSDYFTYINVFYSPEQVQAIVDETLKSEKDLDKFSSWKYSFMKKEIVRLYDLIGTKYIRQNKLEQALFYFGKNEDKTEHKINCSDCFWEKEDCSNRFKSPFFVLKYTPEFVTQKKLYSLNKYTVTQNLISYLKKASKPDEKNKDYYNFLIANCYYNMTFIGSLSEMRRYGSGEEISIRDFPVEDNNEFYECNLAKKYYTLAFKNAKTTKFKALCLRMAGKCEANKLAYRYPDDYENPIKNYNTFLLKKNKYYQDLKSKYADDYEDLISDCNAFEEYFRARR
ncbi:hypothetical protein [Flavobacterium reichenbachii]|uniref:Lipoprotein n=1 Tax=Flavobacterium reichenbachii TaxID=362418 RepID=A0A085ZNX3_9FLAO|nr:hypothetical protein [Flavobacterium reichenbachii]KFF06137.1 hypothetical protein IW19_11615 [Flavobacterium reichenbachii]OXB17639.1 hypothetical protein B0A68_04950 [Flavobacterium reichenbachii]